MIAYTRSHSVFVSAKRSSLDPSVSNRRESFPSRACASFNSARRAFFVDFMPDDDATAVPREHSGPPRATLPPVPAPLNTPPITAEILAIVSPLAADLDAQSLGEALAPDAARNSGTDNRRGRGIQGRIPRGPLQDRELSRLCVLLGLEIRFLPTGGVQVIQRPEATEETTAISAV